MLRLLGLALAVSACGGESRSGPSSMEPQEISFRVAGFVKSMGIT